MKTFKLDPDTQDLLFDEHNNIAMVDGTDEELQALELRLKTNQGEWFLDTLFGLAYSTVLDKQYDEDDIRAAVTQTLEQEERVSEVLEVRLDRERAKRHLNIYFKVQMTSGQVLESEVMLNE